jgi:hypothetical protein
MERQRFVSLLVVIVSSSSSSAHKRFVADNIILNEYSHTSLAWTVAGTIQYLPYRYATTLSSLTSSFFFSRLVWFDCLI